MWLITRTSPESVMMTCVANKLHLAFFDDNLLSKSNCFDCWLFSDVLLWTMISLRVRNGPTTRLLRLSNTVSYLAYDSVCGQLSGNAAPLLLLFSEVVIQNQSHWAMWYTDDCHDLEHVQYLIGWHNIVEFFNCCGYRYWAFGVTHSCATSTKFSKSYLSKKLTVLNESP